MADHTLGSRDAPIHASALPALYRCELMWILRTSDESRGGKAAQTGSAAHKAIELWHAGMSMIDALAKVDEDEEDQWPLYAPREVERMCNAYEIDPRNRVPIVAQELPIGFVLPAHPCDPTGEEISIVGRLDQIRDEGGGHLTLWDIKTSGWPGRKVLDEACLQQAAYIIGARELGYDVRPGGIIRLRGYTTREKQLPGDHDVFFRYPISVVDCHALLDSLPLRVAAMRSGHASVSPGDWCQWWCPSRGLETCRNYFE